MCQVLPGLPGEGALTPRACASWGPTRNKGVSSTRCLRCQVLLSRQAALPPPPATGRRAHGPVPTGTPAPRHSLSCQGPTRTPAHPGSPPPNPCPPRVTPAHTPTHPGSPPPTPLPTLGHPPILTPLTPGHPRSHLPTRTPAHPCSCPPTPAGTPTHPHSPQPTSCSLHFTPAYPLLTPHSPQPIPTHPRSPLLTPPPLTPAHRVHCTLRGSDTCCCIS